MTPQRALFILHEGVGSTIFTSQVMEHATAMRAQGIVFSVLTFETFRRQRAASERNLAVARSNYPFDIAMHDGANMYMPWSTAVNAFLLVKYLRRHGRGVSFLHARADYTAFLCLITKPFHGLPVVWDCRGDAVDELQDSLSRRGALLRRSLGAVLVARQRVMAAVCRRFADGAIFVSNALLALHQAGLRTRHVVVVPCPVPESKFYFDEDLRATGRAARGFTETDRVYVYSGSVVAYQGLEAQGALYARLLADSRNVILFATSDPEQARRSFHALPPDRFQIVSVSYKQMNEIYNVADCAFMLRDAKQLNWVASPTKFGEYCLAGLPVVVNGTVDQVARNAELFGNAVQLDQVAAAPVFDSARRRTVAAAAVRVYARTASVPKYVSLYAGCSAADRVVSFQKKFKE